MSSTLKSKLSVIARKIIPRILQWIGAITVLFFILVGIILLNRGFFLGKLGDFLVLDQDPVKSDIIIILSGGNQDDRVMHGVKLFKQGYGNELLMTGGPGGLLQKSCAEMMRDQAVFLDVSKELILLEEESTTTFGNAKYSLEIIRKKGYRSVIIVTSASHTRRSKIVFERFFSNEGISFIVCAVPSTVNLERWWENDLKVQTVFTEYMKLFWYYFFRDK